MRPVDTDGRLRIAGESTDRKEEAVVTPLKQLFAGLRVGLPTLTVQCCGCGTELGEGEHVSVYVYRTAETSRWHLARCRACVPAEIAPPTLGTTEVRLSARLAVVSAVEAQQHRLCLADPDVLAFAPPADGTPP